MTCKQMKEAIKNNSLNYDELSENDKKMYLHLTNPKKNRKRKIERGYSEDYLDMLWFAEKAIMRGEMTRAEVDEQLKGINPYTFKYEN